MDTKRPNRIEDIVRRQVRSRRMPVPSVPQRPSAAFVRSRRDLARLRLEIVRDLAEGRREPASALREIVFSYRKVLAAVLLVALSVTGVSRFAFRTKAEIAVFHPSSCLGNWLNPAGAQGKPDLKSGDSPELFTVENSAVYTGGGKQMYCGGFLGEMTPHAHIERVALRVVWATESQAALDQYRDAENPPVQDARTETEESAPSDAGKAVVPAAIEPERGTTTDSGAQEAGKSGSGTGEQGENPSGAAPEYQESAPNPSQEPAAEPAAWFRILGDVAHAQAIVTTSNEASTGELPGAVQKQQDVHSETIQEAASTFVEDGEHGIPVPPGAWLGIRYSLDGVTWQAVAYVKKGANLPEIVELPAMQVEDISRFQVSFEPLAEDSPAQSVLLDGMGLEVEYTDPYPDPSPKPDLEKEIIISDVLAEGERLVQVEREGKGRELWHATIREDGEHSWSFVAGGDMVHDQARPAMDSGHVFWLNEDATALYSFNVGSKAYSSVSFNPAQGEISIPYADIAGERKIATMNFNNYQFTFAEAPLEPQDESNDRTSHERQREQR